MNNPHHKNKYQRACDLAKKLGYVSCSVLQRELRLSVFKALVLIEKMQENGIIGTRDERSLCPYIGGEK